MPAGDGVLATLNFNPTILGGTLSMSEISISSENAVEIPSTTPESVDIPGMLASLSLGAFDSSGTLEVLYDFDGPVAGFQFDVTGLALTWRIWWCCRRRSFQDYCRWKNSDWFFNDR